MAVSSWLYRRKRIRRDYTTNKEKKEEKDVTVLDPSKAALRKMQEHAQSKLGDRPELISGKAFYECPAEDEKENTLLILSKVSKIQGLKDEEKIAYLKELHKIIDQSKKQNAVFFMKNEHIFRCLKTCLTNKSAGVRSAGYRVIRTCVSTAEDVVIINELQIPKLIVRSIDIGAKYEDERIQAFRLIVKLLMLNPQSFQVDVLRALISLADGEVGEVKEKLASASVVVLCYLCILNPDLLIECSGHSVLLRCSLEVSNARLNECMLMCLMFLMNKRNMRERANIHLNYVISGYTELEERRVEEDPTPYRISELSVLTILRSWIGLYHFCQPDISGIKVIVDVLYLNRDDLRKAVLELLYQIFGLDRKSWTNDLSVAIENIDPSKYHESWNINQKFVVAEGRDILAHKNFYRPNLSEIHTALVLHAFLESGIMPALVEVILSPDAFLSIQALTLVGVILHLSHKLLPEEIVDLSPGLPKLAEYINHGLPYQRTQALTAISALCKIHEVLKRKPTPKSLFLKQLIYYNNLYKENEIRGISNEIDDYDEQSSEKSETETENENNGPEARVCQVQETLNFYFLQLEFERRNKKQEMKEIDQCINKSNVLWFSDYREWNWDIIETTLKSTDESFVGLQEAYHKNYIKKLIHFYKPSTRTYSEIEYNYKKRELDIITTTAFYLIDFLLQSDEGGKGKYLDDLLLDLSNELREVVVNERLYTIFFNPRHMLHTMSQHYFLIIGRLSGTNKGVKALNKRSLLEICTEIVTSCRHEYYVKLIVSSLNYNVSVRSRQILSAAIASSMESVRHYSTELLLILARLDVQNFSKWGIKLLISLTCNSDKTVATTSINILEELCYDEVYLQSLLDARPSVLHLLEKGDLILIRFLSTETGFLYLSEENYVETELLNWEKNYNHRYVWMVENELNNALTLNDLQDYEKNFKRLTYHGYKHEDVFIPFHLYGELAKHEEGFQALVNNGYVFKMVQNLRNSSCDTDQEILELKSSLWGLSSLSTSKLGFRFLDRENVIQAVVDIAYGCPVLSVRATAFYCLSLISTTAAGADALEKFGWYSVRRNRSEEWPDMDIRLPSFAKLWRSNKLEESKSASMSVASASNFDEVDSVGNRWSQETNFSPSSEKRVTLLARLFKKAKSFEKESVDDSQYLEYMGEKYTTSSMGFGEGRPGTSDSNIYFKKKASSSSFSLNGGSEGAITRKFRLWDALNFHNFRSLYNRRSKLKAQSDSKVQLLEGITSQIETVNTVSSSSSQMDMASEAGQGMLTDKFVLSYKGVSLPKSLSQIFTNIPNPSSGSNPQETLPSQGEEEILPNNLAEMGATQTEEDRDDSRRVPGSDGDSASSQSSYSHHMESCIGCCTKVRKRFARTHTHEDDQSKADNVAEAPAARSETSPVDDGALATRSESPLVVDEAPASRSESPLVDNEMPSAPSETPPVDDEAPAARSETPPFDDEALDTRSESPLVVDETPSARSETPPVDDEALATRSESPSVNDDDKALATRSETLPVDDEALATRSESPLVDDEVLATRSEILPVDDEAASARSESPLVVDEAPATRPETSPDDDVPAARSESPLVVDEAPATRPETSPDDDVPAARSESPLVVDEAPATRPETSPDDDVPAARSESPLVDDEATPKEDTVPPEATTDKKDESEISTEEEKTVPELRNYDIVVRQIMTQIGRMYNPVISKAAGTELTVLKRRYPNAFRDVCLYSSVCNVLSSSSCRLTSRSFIQQLFNDVVYCMVYEDAARALRLYTPADSPPAADNLLVLSESHSSVQKNGSLLELYKPAQTKTVIANRAPRPKKNPFDDVPVTTFEVRPEEVPMETGSADSLPSSSHN